MCILLKDEEKMVFQEKETLKEYLGFREKHDKWMVAPVQQMKVYTLGENESVEAFRKRTGTSVTDENITECRSTGTNMFLLLHTELNNRSVKGVIPLRYTAVRSLLDRAKIGGQSITNTEAVADADVLPLEKKVEIINECLKLYNASAKALYRDEKISCVMSGQYAVLAEKEIVDTVEAGLQQTFPNAEFSNGYASHESFRAEYRLQEREIEEDILIALNDAGVGAERVEAVLGVFTSDIGSAAATIYSYLRIDDKKMFFGKPHGIKHIGNKTCKDIQNAVDKTYSMFVNSAEDLKLLAETKIMNPAGCLRLIAREFHLPKKFAMEAAEELENSGTTECSAYEIFWYLNDIVRRFDEAKKDVFRSMNLQEAVAETVRLNFKRFDKPFEWVRGGSVEAE